MNEGRNKRRERAWGGREEGSDDVRQGESVSGEREG